MGKQSMPCKRSRFSQVVTYRGDSLDRFHCKSKKLMEKNSGYTSVRRFGGESECDVNVWHYRWNGRSLFPIERFSRVIPLAPSLSPRRNNPKTLPCTDRQWFWWMQFKRVSRSAGYFIDVPPMNASNPWNLQLSIKTAWSELCWLLCPLEAIRCVVVSWNFRVGF